MNAFLKALSILASLGSVFASSPSSGVHALTRFGRAEYAHGFSHFGYVNPKAPKGGALRIGTVGIFDTLNKDVIKGIAAEGLISLSDPLMIRSMSEPFTIYGLLAESVELAPNNASITYHLNPKAKFHDGSQVTAEDVKFTFEFLQRPECWPRYRQFYSRIAKIEILDPHTLRLSFKPTEKGDYDPELPLVVSSARILCKKQMALLSSSQSGLTPIIGSGPYKIKSVEPGRSVTYARDPDYWGRDLPVNKGQNNFDTIRIDYFKNVQAHFQAFLGGALDVYFETNPQQWMHGYDVPSVQKETIVREEVKHQRPVMVRTFLFNMKRSIFSDRRLREALWRAFDFQSLNTIVYQGMMGCPRSLFENTFLAHQGVAEGMERQILEEVVTDKDFLKKILDHPFQSTSTLPLRDRIKKADQSLREAGWTVNSKGQRVNVAGEVLTLEFLLKDPKLEKIALHYQQNLKPLGIILNVRLVDAVQYENRVTDRNFDMIIHAWSNSLSPGNEQFYYFSTQAADIRGSSNYMGVKDPVAETLAKKVITAKTKEELTASVRALDRYVMHQFYQIPFAFDNTFRWAYSKDHVAHPPKDPQIGINVMALGWYPEATLTKKG